MIEAYVSNILSQGRRWESGDPKTRKAIHRKAEDGFGKQRRPVTQVSFLGKKGISSKSFLPRTGPLSSVNSGRRVVGEGWGSSVFS